VREEGYDHELSQSKRYRLKAINRMALGSILILWGGLLTLRQVGIIAKDVSTWPFAFIAFGTLLVIGGIHRLYARS